MEWNLIREMGKLKFISGLGVKGIEILRVNRLRYIREWGMVIVTFGGFVHCVLMQQKQVHSLQALV